MSDFTIEEVTDLDAAWPELLPLCEAQARYHAGLLGLELLFDWETRQRAMLEHADSVIYLVRREGQPIAFLNAYITRDGYLFADEGVYINNVYVAPEARRLGIAKALVERVEGWVAAQGLGRLDLYVVANNELGLEFWRDAGYAPRSYSFSKTLEARS